VTDPRTYTVHRALDGATDAATLHAMATQRPDLRQFVAANPNTPTDVLAWLGQLGDPAVDAALRRRAPVEVSAPMGTGYDPYANPYAATPQPNPYGVDHNPYATTTTTTTTSSDGKRVGLIVALVGAGILAILVVAFIVVWNLVGGIARTGIEFDSNTSLEEGYDYGDNPVLDAMWDDCAEGDGAACDDLYLNSRFGTRYEEFGNSCGGRFDPDTVWCDSVM